MAEGVGERAHQNRARIKTMRVNKKLIFCVVLLGWGWTAMAPSALAQRDRDATPDPSEIARVLAEANELLRQAESASPMESMQLLDRARDYYGELLLMFAGYPEAMFGLAEVARLQGQGAEARDRYNEYIDTPSGRNDFRAHEGLGEVFLMSNYFQMALPKFRKATELNAASASAWIGYARALLGLRELDQAYAAAQRGNSLEPNNVTALGTIADVCLNSVRDTEEGVLFVKDPEWLNEGIRVCNRSISLLRSEWEKAPEIPEPLDRIDGFYGKLIKFSEFQLRSEQNVSPDHILRLVESRREQLRIQSLLSDYTSLRLTNVGIQQIGEDVRLYILAAELERNLLLWDPCRQACEKALKLDPDNVEARAILDSIPED